MLGGPRRTVKVGIGRGLDNRRDFMPMASDRIDGDWPDVMLTNPGELGNDELASDGVPTSCVGSGWDFVALGAGLLAFGAGLRLLTELPQGLFQIPRAGPEILVFRR